MLPVLSREVVEGKQRVAILDQALDAKYSHLADDPMRRAVNLIGNEINAAMTRKPGAVIIPLKTA